VDYSGLAMELLNKMRLLHKAKSQRCIDEALQGEAFVLHYIMRHGDDVLPGEICDEMNVSSARIAQTLNNIEKKGWITRQISLNDRRKILVKLTQEGKNAAEKHNHDVVEIAAKMLYLLGEHDAKEYVRITGKLAGIISDYKESL